MEIPKLEDLVLMTFEEQPDSIAHNGILWGYIARALASHNNITTRDGLILALVEGTIPNQHSIAAAASNVRKTHPQYNPTEEQRKNKEQIKQEYINRAKEIKNGTI